MNKEMLTSAYLRLRERLFSRARNVTRNDNDAQDILQDAFIRLWSSHTDISRPEHAEGLLNVTVRNLSIDNYRRTQDHPTTPVDSEPDRDDGATELYERQQVIDRVNEIISLHLSERDREILLRRDRDEWSFEELAEHFNLTPANVRMIVSRARATVRNIYKTDLS
ncbi:MAG: sigma-70 family RNA polymerase sigma factor [Muribaculaceae bacterium]|nr:sigma-70 family RNA polymerase sigma factor [Muribaculaceae bacterium]